MNKTEQDLYNRRGRKADIVSIPTTTPPSPITELTIAEQQPETPSTDSESFEKEASEETILTEEPTPKNIKNKSKKNPQQTIEEVNNE